MKNNIQLSLDEENPLNELFHRDPFEYVEQDITKLVAYYREQREKFLLKEKTKSPSIRRSKKELTDQAKKKMASLSSDDLFAELNL